MTRNDSLFWLSVGVLIGLGAGNATCLLLLWLTGRS